MMSSVNKEFYFSLTSQYIFFPFSFLAALARTSSSGARGSLALIPDLSRETLSFSQLSMMLIIGLFVDVLYQGEEVLLIPSLPRMFS